MLAVVKQPTVEYVTFIGTYLDSLWWWGGFHKGPEPVRLRPWLFLAQQSGAAIGGVALRPGPPLVSPALGHPFIHPDKRSISPVDTVTICEKQQTNRDGFDEQLVPLFFERNGTRRGKRSKSHCSGYDEHRPPHSPG